MIALRDMQRKDRDRVRAWRNLPAVARFMYTDHEIAADEHAAWFGRILLDPSCTYWIVTRDGADVGLACITDIDRTQLRCSLGIYIADSGLHGHGIGGAAAYQVIAHVFDALKLETLCCEVLDSNTKAQELYQRLGFREQRRLPRHVRKGETWHDAIAMAMQREDWLAVRPGIEARLSAKGLLPEPAALPELP